MLFSTLDALRRAIDFLFLTGPTLDHRALDPLYSLHAHVTYAYIMVARRTRLHRKLLPYLLRPAPTVKEEADACVYVWVHMWRGLFYVGETVDLRQRTHQQSK
jgi:hypothetical protein